MRTNNILLIFCMFVFTCITSTFFLFRINPNKLQSPYRKLEAFLAQDVNLKETAQRAFVAYVKSVFLMKDKKIFNVHALNTDAYSK